MFFQQLPPSCTLAKYPHDIHFPCKLLLQHPSDHDKLTLILRLKN